MGCPGTDDSGGLAADPGGIPVTIEDIHRGLTEGISFLRRQPNERKGYRLIPSDNVVDSGSVGVPMVADEGYFRIVLAEMFLRDRREYWNAYVPFVLMVCDFLYDGQRRSVPVFVGKEALQGLETYLGNEAVEYRNTVLVGPVPYAGDDLGLLIALFRSRSDDLAEKLMGIVGDIGSLFPLADLSRYLAILAPLRRGVETILGIKDVQFRLSTREVFNERNSFQSGFIVLANCSEEQMEMEELWVRNNQLLVGPTGQARRAMTFDYCLLKIEFEPDRNFAALPFARLWTDIKGMVWEGQVSKAEVKFLEMCSQLAVSPDLTNPHRADLMRVYKMKLEREFEMYKSISGTAGSASRGPAAGRISGLARIQHLTNVAKDLAPGPVGQAILDMSKKWDTLPGLMDRAGNDDLEAKTLRQQVSALPPLPQQLLHSSDYPKKLVDVITADTLSLALGRAA
jgi:hypothetical protein